MKHLGGSFYIAILMGLRGIVAYKRNIALLCLVSEVLLLWISLFLFFFQTVLVNTITVTVCNILMKLYSNVYEVQTACCIQK